MPTALEIAESTQKFLEGKDPGPEYRSKYNDQNIVGSKPGGSQNIPLLHARNALIYHHIRGEEGKVLDILDAWAEYCDGPLMTGEVFSCNIYAAWIMESILVADAMACEYTHYDAAEGTFLHLNTYMALCALSSGWIPNPAGGFKGYPCVMTGSRSWNGPAKYMVSASSFHSGFMDSWLSANRGWLIDGLLKLTDEWEADYPDDHVYYRTIRSKVIDDRDLATLQQTLDRGPRPLVGAKIVRTDKSVFFGTEGSVNTGSTCWLPGKGWTTELDGYYRTHPYSPDKTSFWLSVDRPRRIWGGKVAGVFKNNDDGSVRFEAQRTSTHRDRDYPPNSWWDEEKGEDVMGWRSVTIPGKPNLWVHISQQGYRIEKEGDVIEPPPPPPSGKIDMLEVMAPSSLNFAKTSSVKGIQSTIRDDANKIFTVVKGEGGTAWDWFYWDDDYIYHFLTEDQGWLTPKAFKTHVKPGVIWCKRWATLGETHTSDTRVHRWDNCLQFPAISLAEARTTLHKRVYTASELGFSSPDVPGSTVCYRIDWRWGPNADQTETFTYAVGWGFLDWDRPGYDVKSYNLRSPKPLVMPNFPCFNVAEWVDRNMREADPPPSENWNTVVMDRAYLKFTEADAKKALATITEGENHINVSKVAFLPGDLAQLKRKLEAL